MKRYRDANREVLTRHGAKFLMMGGKNDVVEGNPDEVRSNFTVVEFPTHQAAVDCFNSAEYQEASKWPADDAGLRRVLVHL